MKAALYCRVSTEEQAKEGFSIQAQQNVLESYCSIKNLEIFNVYKDEGISGKTTERPAFKRMLEDAGKGLFNVVVVWKINRFSRKTADLLNVVEYLNKKSINLISYSEQFDASTPSGRLMLSMLGSIGEFERDTIVENIKAGLNERARQGFHNGGRVLGYDSANAILKVNERESYTVKMIFKLFLSGYTMGNIQKALMSEGLRTKNGCIFDISSIRRILKNPLYAGYIAYGNMLIKGKHQPLICEKEYESVQRILNSRSQKHRKPGSFILSGLIICPFCKNTMTGHSTSKGYRYYVCSKYKKSGRMSCRGKIINAEDIEAKVMDIIFEFLNSGRVINDVYNRIEEIYPALSSSLPCDAEHLKKELYRRQNIRLRYMDLFEAGSINSDILASRLMKVEKEIETIEKKLSLINDKLRNSQANICFDKVCSLLSNFKNIFISLECIEKKRLISSIVRSIGLDYTGKITAVTYKFPAFAQSGSSYTDYNIKCDLHP